MPHCISQSRFLQSRPQSTSRLTENFSSTSSPTAIHWHQDADETTHSTVASQLLRQDELNPQSRDSGGFSMTRSEIRYRRCTLKIATVKQHFCHAETIVE
ncbi:hypothetical protein EJ04DRAFT_196545 [Polyplosphaeria fusca]|uniref:Uncharacterized protein n=1 Tax=Polyplosphaeria fusca TaxID=682080 RepID=A0A9P4V571_9PLEO|nr:hypothetical protein EJ04DRAFT_196545 [Polyplosphaeria fusca]